MYSESYWTKVPCGDRPPAAALVRRRRRRYIRLGMSSPPTVFVVDDDASVQKALVRLLRSAGYQARGFSSARAFLDAYTPVGPGCLIVDLQMPDITGLDLMETLRVTDTVLEVIFLSGRGDVPTTAKAMKM